jgi:hypothetical protein
MVRGWCKAAVLSTEKVIFFYFFSYPQQNRAKSWIWHPAALWRLLVLWAVLILIPKENAPQGNLGPFFSASSAPDGKKEK